MRYGPLKFIDQSRTCYNTLMPSRLVFFTELQFYLWFEGLRLSDGVLFFEIEPKCKNYLMYVSSAASKAIADASFPQDTI